MTPTKDPIGTPLDVQMGTPVGKPLSIPANEPLSTLTGTSLGKPLSIGNKPKYASSQPSSFMKTLAEEDVFNRLKRFEAEKEYSILGEEADAEETI